MVSRRDFIKAASLAGSAAIFHINKAYGKPVANEYFGLNDFIESHPDAVFILKTNVDVKTNTSAIKDAGHLLGQTIFVSRDAATGYPIASTNIAIKPNIVTWEWDGPGGQTYEQAFPHIMGVQTNANFVEGVINSLQSLAIGSEKIFLREANYYGGEAIDAKWYSDMAARTGVNIKDLSATIGTISEDDIHWTDVPNGVWFNKIPHLWPVNSANSCLINIAKLKSHGMGMTLCSKNIQGTNAIPYVRHCTSWGADMIYGDPPVAVDPNHIVPNAFATIKANYDNHKKFIPRWNTSGGLGMETWAARCLDNNSVLHPLINIIEGVYGREGPFFKGPGTDGYGIDKMANVVIFGKNARHVDIIGKYLAGHEPGNFGLFHIAKERGLAKTINPNDPTNLPLYEWKSDGTAAPMQFADLTQMRTPIRTLYLRQSGEAEYHMVNQAYDYGTNAVVETKHTAPDVFAVEQNFPNPFNPVTSIQYYIPKSGNVRLEIFDIRGQLVDVLVDSYMPAGDHLNVWNSAQKASGTYFYRLLYGGISQTKSMILIK